MPKGFMPKESEDGMKANRLTRRTRIKEGRKQAKRAERMPSYLRKPTDLSAIPLWSKILIGGIFFAYCGGMEVLDAISRHSQGDSGRLTAILFVAVLGVAFYCYQSLWVAKSDAPSKTCVARNPNDSPMEMVHGKWRLKSKGPVAALPAQRTPGQLKERQPSKEYNMDSQQPPMASLYEVGQQLRVSSVASEQGPRALL